MNCTHCYAAMHSLNFTCNPNKSAVILVQPLRAVDEHVDDGEWHENTTPTRAITRNMHANEYNVYYPYQSSVLSLPTQVPSNSSFDCTDSN